ncbi:hypothetical protein GUU82_17980 [Escherichia coli]|nr:hypothetical protein GUU82_17980 [Escherichia coli]HBA5993023.1 hypothetical protein [Escherichia coli]
MEARVTVAGMGLVMEVQDYFDGEADRLAKAWLAEYTPQIKSLQDERKEAYRQIVEMSTEPQDVDLVRPANKFEMTRVREGEKEADLPVWKHHLLCDESGNYPALLNHWETKVFEIETKREGFAFWYRNPQYTGQSSLGIAYVEAEQYKIVRPDFLFFAEQDGKMVVDLVDPHSLHLADALPKLEGLALYAEHHSDAYRRIESVAEVKGKLRVLDLKRQDVQDAVATAENAETLFSSGLADDYQ